MYCQRGGNGLLINCGLVTKDGLVIRKRTAVTDEGGHVITLSRDHVVT